PAGKVEDGALAGLSDCEHHAGGVTDVSRETLVCSCHHPEVRPGRASDSGHGGPIAWHPHTGCAVQPHTLPHGKRTTARFRVGKKPVRSCGRLSFRSRGTAVRRRSSRYAALRFGLPWRISPPAAGLRRTRERGEGTPSDGNSDE